MGKIQRNKNISFKSSKLKTNGTSFVKMKKNLSTHAKNAYSKRQYSEMSLDDFLTKGLDELDSESEENEEMSGGEQETSEVSEIEKENDDEEELSESNEDKKSDQDSDEEQSSKSNEESESNQDSDVEESEEMEENSGDEVDSADTHKKSLAKLKDTDPEFYKFLQENDKKLLDFNLSDSDSDDKEVEDGDNEDDNIHKPPEELEVASDESDFEDNTKGGDDTLITLKMLKLWQSEIRTDKSNNTINKLIQAFHAAILRVSNKDDDDQVVQYKVEGSAIFNGVMQICVLELGPALRRYLRIPPGSKIPPHKCKKYVKIKAVLRGYFIDLLKLLNGVTSSNILTVLLKHLHYMSAMIVSYGNVLKHLLKKLIHLWGTADETVRVVAFLCILRLVNNQQHNNLDMVLKSMYMTYVQNSKFVSPSTLPMINFMRRSLVEMFTIDINVAYQHVFLYIRQLAIHLRNAITVKKKEHIQAVYNWQYINSLRLWENLLSVTNMKPQLQSLIYPFVQVCLGTINLIPTTQYYPLRFHIIEMLIEFSCATNVFIPILPFLIEVLTSFDFNKKHQKVSMKPLQFLCILRLSKSQLQENGFKDAVIDTIYGLVLEYLSHHSSSIAFPDLSLFCVIQIKAFLKKCSVAAYCRKMRQLLEKIEQNSKFITEERKNVTFTLTATKQIEAWETTLKNKGTPLSTYFESWKKMKNVKKSKEATNNEAIGDYQLPVLKKVNKAGGKPENASSKVSEKVELFPSDSESENENESKALSKPRRGKRGGKKFNKKPIAVVLEEDDNEQDIEDIVQDLKASDW